MTAAAPSLSSRVWPRVRAFGAVRLIGLVIGALAFAYLWIDADGRFPETTVWQVPLMLLLLVLSLPWRTVSARTVVRWFFIGFGPIFFATVVTQALLVASPLQQFLSDLSSELLLANVGSLGNIHATIWAPITEEVWKLVPLLVLLGWGRSHLRTQAGPLDFAILAAAVGAGLGMAEDIFQVNDLSWTTPASPFLGLGLGTLWLIVVNFLNALPIPVVELEVSYQAIVSILNPSVEELQNGAIWAGHGVLPMLTGLALGFAVLGRRRLGPVVYVVPVLTLLWAIWDHFVANWYSPSSCESPEGYTLCSLAQLDLTGGLFPLVAIAAWVLAMVISRRIVARHMATDPELGLRRPEISSAAYRSAGGLWPIRFASDVLHYLVMRGRSSFGSWHIRRSSAEDQEAQAEALVAARIQEAALAARLRNAPLPALPAHTQENVARLTSPL